MWYFIHHSGVHATVAGVLTALAVPNKAKNGSPLQKLAHGLTKPVNYIIMPLFALANTDIRFTSEMLEGVGGVLSLGIIIGLVAGKPLGVMLASWLSVKTKIGKLPDGFARKHILGIGLLAGIGFTMSIFMSFLSFGNSTQDAQSKLAIMLASLIAGSSGYVYLKNKLSVKAKPKIPVQKVMYENTVELICKPFRNTLIFISAFLLICSDRNFLQTPPLISILGLKGVSVKVKLTMTTCFMIQVIQFWNCKVSVLSTAMHRRSTP